MFKNEGIELKVVPIATTQYMRAFLHKEKGLIITECLSDFVPIASFKSFFLELGRFLNDFPVTTMIFDKRSLRVFHQPSMEWYFVHWKEQVKAKGLVNHYKILPELEWFKRSVEAGKVEIEKAYPEILQSDINVSYFNSIEEAILAFEAIKA